MDTRKGVHCNFRGEGGKVKGEVGLKYVSMARALGEVAERLNAADSKSVLGQPNGGSNPPLSVDFSDFPQVTSSNFLS
jgi:hypothetical protein